MKGIRNFCKKQSVPMSNYKIAKLIKRRSHFKCEVCDKIKMAKAYEYQSNSHVGGYTPKHFKEICADCIYKMVFGSIKWRKEKKEGSLDK